MLVAMWVFPLVAAAIALAFAILLARQFAARRRPYQALWAIALFMYAAASAALFLGVLRGWTPTVYRAYWLFGAVLNVPFLAQGQMLLLVRNRAVTSALSILLLFLTAFAVARVRTAPLAPGELAKDLPLGKDVFGDGSLPYRLSQLYAYPAYFLLLGGSAWSAWRMRERPELRDRAAGAALIAVGATIVAVGSGVGAGLDVVPVFSIGLAAGIAVMFLGFLRASRPRRDFPPVR